MINGENLVFWFCFPQMKCRFKLSIKVFHHIRSFKFITHFPIVVPGSNTWNKHIKNNNIRFKTSLLYHFVMSHIPLYYVKCAKTCNTEKLENAFYQAYWIFAHCTFVILRYTLIINVIPTWQKPPVVPVYVFGYTCKYKRIIHLILRVRII